MSHVGWYVTLINHKAPTYGATLVKYKHVDKRRGHEPIEGHIIDKVPSKIYRAKENVACPKSDFIGLHLSDFTFNTWYMEVWVV